MSMSSKSHGISVLVLVLALAAIWPALAEAAGPFSYYPLTPCRFVDTREPTLQGGAPIPRFVPVTFTAKGRCAVPLDAKAISVNATVVLPTGAGFLTLYPSDAARPWISVVDWAATDNALANGAIVPLATATVNEISAYHETDGAGTVHLVLDVTGYFK